MKKLFVIGAVIFYGSLAVLAGDTAREAAAGWYEKQKRIDRAEDRKRDLQRRLKDEQFPAYEDRGFQYLERQRRIQDLEDQIRDEEQYIYEERNMSND